MARNARLGLILFSVYLVLYGGFVLVNAFNPDSMEWTPIEGVNLAILSGFGLIIAALLISLLYGFLCNRNDAESSAEAAPESSSTGGDK